MSTSNRFLALILFILVVLFLIKNSQKDNVTVKSEPATIEAIIGSDFKKITLTEKAVERIGIETASVTEKLNPRTRRREKTIPYSAVIYDLNGETWTYANPQPRNFVRYPISIDNIEGDTAVLSKGPDAKTLVVSVGASELYGIETGIGK